MTRHTRMIPCPYCGESIKSDAAACPYCGSDEKTGWSADTYLDGIDLPEDVEYEDLRAREFYGVPGRKPRQNWIMVIAGIVLAVFLAGIIAFSR